MRARHPAHRLLEEPQIVGGAQRVRSVAQGNLELGRAAFGNRRAGGDAHRVAGGIERVEEARKGVEAFKVEHLAMGHRAAAGGSAGGVTRGPSAAER